MADEKPREVGELRAQVGGQAVDHLGAPAVRGLAVADVAADLPIEADQLAVHGEGGAQPSLANPGFEVGEPGGVAGGCGGRLDHYRETAATRVVPVGTSMGTAPNSGRDQWVDLLRVHRRFAFASALWSGFCRYDCTVSGLVECNAAITEILVQLNGRVMRRLGVSRRELFETVERPAMQPLPATEHEYAEWTLARVGIDYHVEAAGFFYSVPYGLIRQQVETRLTERTVEVFHRGQRIAAHARRYGGPRHGTLPDHMPSAHRLYAEWNPERFQSQARAIGPNTEALIIAVLARRPHPEQGFRTCLGILRLYRGIDAVRAEAVSVRAVEIGALNYQSVASIIEHRLDGRRRRSPRTAHRSCTPISAVPATTIEENDVAAASHDRSTARARFGGHGQEPARTVGQS